MSGYKYLNNDLNTIFISTGKTGVQLLSSGLDLQAVNTIKTAGSLYLYTSSATTGSYFELVANGDPKLIFNYNNGTSGTGTISSINSGGSYVVASDRRLKENIEDIPYGINEIMRLKPSKFNYIRDPSNTYLGFIAQEIKEVIPDVVDLSGPNGPNDMNSYHSLSLSELIPVLVKAMQEQQLQINELIQRITYLENK